MKWRGRRTSRNIDDRRGGGDTGGRTRMTARRASLGRRRAGGRAGGLGVIGLLAVLAIGWYLGIDVSPFIQLVGPGQDPYGGRTVALDPGPAALGPNEIDDETEEFIAVVLADTEEVWADEFAAIGRSYRRPTLVLFSGRTGSACGTASSAAGPFYCPGDRQIYLDAQFFRTLEQRLGAGGDFARAYVIAHEVAHHVQNELGILGQMNAVRMRAGQREANRISVQLELQADCLSGVWAHAAEARFGILEPGDIEEAVNAAAQIGDDTLQRNAGRAVVPDSFTHGTSEQRVRWFRRGFEDGSAEACDTFSAARL
ncbi:MAG: neutral zinc metallopeptidase [Paracoccaceae bacterium]